MSWAAQDLVNYDVFSGQGAIWKSFGRGPSCLQSSHLDYYYDALFLRPGRMQYVQTSVKPSSNVRAYPWISNIYIYICFINLYIYIYSQLQLSLEIGRPSLNWGSSVKSSIVLKMIWRQCDQLSIHCCNYNYLSQTLRSCPGMDSQRPCWMSWGSSEAACWPQVCLAGRLCSSTLLHQSVAGSGRLETKPKNISELPICTLSGIWGVPSWWGSWSVI